MVKMMVMMMMKGVKIRKTRILQLSRYTLQLRRCFLDWNFLYMKMIFYILVLISHAMSIFRDILVFFFMLSLSVGRVFVNKIDHNDLNKKSAKIDEITSSEIRRDRGLEVRQLESREFNDLVKPITLKKENRWVIG